MCSQVLLGRARKIIPAIRISRPTVYLPEIRLSQHDSAPYPHREKIPANPDVYFAENLFKYAPKRLRACRLYCLWLFF